jgi:obg-like ATPase 1
MPPKKAAAPEDVGAARFGRVRNNLKMGIVGLPNVVGLVYKKHL